MPSKALLKAITSPARVASLLDSSKGRPLLALEIQRHRIGRALVYSPMDHPGDVEGLTDILLRPSTLVDDHHKKKSATAASLVATRRISKDALEELASTMRTEDVCGVLVGWPLQRDTGKMGGPCGRVLYTLEAILEWSSNQQHGRNHRSRQARPLLSCQRPLCLWTPQSVLEQASAPEDEWGRCAAYGKTDEEVADFFFRGRTANQTTATATTSTTTKTLIHFASREQYAFDETAQATDLWEDFWKSHWPDVYRKCKARRLQQQRNDAASAAASSSSSRRRGGGPHGNNLVTNWRDSPAAYMMTADVVL